MSSTHGRADTGPFVTCPADTGSSGRPPADRRWRHRPAPATRRTPGGTRTARTAAQAVPVPQRPQHRGRPVDLGERPVPHVPDRQGQEPAREHLADVGDEDDAAPVADGQRGPAASAPGSCPDGPGAGRSARPPAEHVVQTVVEPVVEGPALAAAPVEAGARRARGAPAGTAGPRWSSTSWWPTPRPAGAGRPRSRPGPRASSRRPRPVETRKNTLQSPASSSRTRPDHLGQLVDRGGGDGGVDLEAEADPPGRPARLHREGERPRNAPERVVGRRPPAPSSENETAPAPAARTRGQVGLGGERGARRRDRHGQTGPAPWAMSSRRSARLNGSPPVSTTIGRGEPAAARSSRTAVTSAVDSSPGWQAGWASARQWVHARSQARVVSNRTRNGRSSTS